MREKKTHTERERERERERLKGSANRFMKAGWRCEKEYSTQSFFF